jgi:hypothetical protein
VPHHTRLDTPPTFYGSGVNTFSLSGPDNDRYMLTNLPESARCPSCARSLDAEWIDPLFVIAERHFDVSFTYDGYCIVSERFRDAVGDRGARYIDLPSEPSFFALFPAARVAFDPVRRRTRFTNHCPDCDRWHEVAGATPAFLLEEPPPTELRGTDVEFGSGDEQHPLLIVGSKLADELRAADLKGVELRPCPGRPVE